VAVVTVRAGHVQPVWAGHPWVYAQAVARVAGGATAGDEVEVVDEQGHVLGRGLYSPGSAIAVRLYTRDRSTRVDAALFERRVSAATARRRDLGLPSDETTAYRAVHAEGDDLPGLIVDRYGDVLVVQIGTIGMKRREAILLDALERELAPRAILDRSSERAAKAEGFEPGSGVVRGDANVSELSFRERGLAFRIPFELGQKTGYYLDQRPLRARVEALAKGRRVLDTFSYVGAIALGAARGGASAVHAVDQSALALEVAAECARENGLSDRIEFERADAHDALAYAGRKGGYDLVVCDPPKLAPTRAAKKRALASMRRLAAAGLRATRLGGLCVLCSCSAAIAVDELTRAAALGGRDVGLRPIVLERWFQGADHPVPAAFPEGLYLSSLILEVQPL
jgi:23S rRNA (cytosine1962-C5)-methyltransferase